MSLDSSFMSTGQRNVLLSTCDSMWRKIVQEKNSEKVSVDVDWAVEEQYGGGLHAILISLVQILYPEK